MPSRRGKKGRKRRRKQKRANEILSTLQPRQQRQYAAAASTLNVPMSGSVPPPYVNLRFAPGDIVLAHYDYWRRGKILECNTVKYYADAPPERIAYKLLCDDKCMCAPKDTEMFIRPFSKEALLTLDSTAPDPLLLNQEFPAGMVGLGESREYLGSTHTCLGC